MIANLENNQVLDHAESLAGLISQSEPFRHYISRRQAVARSEQAQKLIQRFSNIKVKYEEVQRFGRYHPDFKKVIQETMTAKREMDLYPLIAEFKQAEKGMQDFLGAVSAELAGSVSKSIKVPNGDPFFDHGCGSGGSCKCGTH